MSVDLDTVSHSPSNSSKFPFNTLLFWKVLLKIVNRLFTYIWSFLRKKNCSFIIFSPDSDVTTSTATPKEAKKKALFSQPKGTMEYTVSRETITDKNQRISYPSQNCLFAFSLTCLFITITLSFYTVPRGSRL